MKNSTETWQPAAALISPSNLSLDKSYHHGGISAMQPRLAKTPREVSAVPQTADTDLQAQRREESSSSSRHTHQRSLLQFDAPPRNLFDAPQGGTPIACEQRTSETPSCQRNWRPFSTSTDHRLLFEKMGVSAFSEATLTAHLRTRRNAGFDWQPGRSATKRICTRAASCT